MLKLFSSATFLIGYNGLGILTFANGGLFDSKSMT